MKATEFEEYAELLVSLRKVDLKYVLAVKPNYKKPPLIVFVEHSLNVPLKLTKTERRVASIKNKVSK